MDSFNFSTASRTINDDLNYSMNRTRALLGEIGNQPSLNQSTVGSPGSRLFNKSSLLNTTGGGHLLASQAQSSSFDQKENQSSIFTEFKLKSDSFLDEDLNLKELLKSYESICAEQVTFIRDQISSNYSQAARSKQTAAELDDLEREKELWNLISALYFDEYGPASRSNRTGMNDGTIAHMSDDYDNENYLTMEADEMRCDESSEVNYGVNEGLLIRHLERKNPLFRRIKLIIGWLEKQMAQSEYMKTVKEKISSFQETSASWEHTLHHLKNQNKKMQFSSREYVTELDPDAPVRQNKPLHDLDQEDEYRIMEFVFAFVRAGDVNGAKDLCFKVGQSWRAATLEGFKLYNDENFLAQSRANATGKQVELKLNEGNMNRDVWKLIVNKMIKDEHFNKYEKALYASLAGIVGPVIPVCRTYADFIWAYLKALYNQMIEREIKQKMPFREFAHMPYDSDEDNLFNKFTHQINNATITQIFDRIAVLINNIGMGISGLSSAGMVGGGVGGYGSHSMGYSLSGATNTTSKEALFLKQDLQRPFSVVLKHVIQSGVDGFHTGTNELMEYLKTIVVNENQSGHLLRFSSHLALLYRSASLQLKNDLFVALNERFVQYLIDHNYKELIAYYLSHLPSQIQIKYYSKFLQGVSENKERLFLLKLAKERNMDVQAITLNIVDNLSHQLDAGDSARGGQSNKSMAFQPNMTALGNRTDLLITSSLASASAKMTGSGGGQQLNEEDKSKINALDWIVYDPLQRFKLLEYANLTMRYFLLQRQNFEATKQVYSKIPHDTLTLILGQYNCSIEATLQQIIDNLPRNVSNAIKEYLCFKEYIEAINLYNEWFEHFYKEKPAKPASAHDNELMQQSSGDQQPTNFAERIAMDYQLKQYEDIKARWYAKALQNCSRVKGKFFSVLKFPHGGWMCDSKEAANSEESASDDQDDAYARGSKAALDADDECISSDEEDAGAESQFIEGDTDMRCDDEDESSVVNVVKKPRFSHDKSKSTGQPTSQNQAKERIGQLRELRKLYLPSIFFLLADMLNKMELYDEIVKLSDLIASAHYNLHSLFTTSQLKSILNKIADASTNLLDKNRDYLGYN